jgi:2-hydroxychromene-2-carboxylate isomerase
MGQLIILAERLADRSRPARSEQPAFFFDVACPFSYLAAERVERILGDVEWIPTASSLLDGQDWAAQTPRMRREAERRAAELRLPLVWPDGFPARAVTALRAASYAAEIGAGGRFALAASRLAFCGGFDLEDPEILAEAAAAAAIPLDAALAAAGDPTRDGALHATARGLVSRGVRRLPAIRVGKRWFSGEHVVGEAAALLRARAAAEGPLAPAG